MTKKPRKTKKGKKDKPLGNDKTLFELRPLRSSAPVTPFMCFHTPDDNVFIKCDWNPDERRFNKNCRQVGRKECIGGE